MKKTIVAALGLLIALAPGSAFAGDLTGRSSVGLFGGAAVPIMSKRIRQITKEGGDFGIMFRYGLGPNWEGAFSVERHNVRQVAVTPILFSGIYHFAPGEKMSPVVRLGLGYVRIHGVGSTVDADDRIAIKPGAGVEAKMCSHFSLGVYLDFLFSPQASRDDKIYGAFTGSMMAIYHFGGKKT